jgi:hypothetical protein
VRWLKQRRRETGTVGPRWKLEPHGHTLAALIQEQPDRTLAELQEVLGLLVGLPTISRAVQQLELRVKKAVRPGDIVIADHLNAHKAADARCAIERVGAALGYLPPCNPDVNPLGPVSHPLRDPVPDSNPQSAARAPRHTGSSAGLLSAMHSTADKTLFNAPADPAITCGCASGTSRISRRP